MPAGGKAGSVFQPPSGGFCFGTGGFTYRRTGRHRERICRCRKIYDPEGTGKNPLKSRRKSCLDSLLNETALVDNPVRTRRESSPYWFASESALDWGSVPVASSPQGAS